MHQLLHRSYLDAILNRSSTLIIQDFIISADAAKAAADRNSSMDERSSPSTRESTPPAKEAAAAAAGTSSSGATGGNASAQAGRAAAAASSGKASKAKEDSGQVKDLRSTFPVSSHHMYMCIALRLNSVVNIFASPCKYFSVFILLYCPFQSSGGISSGDYGYHTHTAPSSALEVK